jgi:hypothetical protein
MSESVPLKNWLDRFSSEAHSDESILETILTTFENTPAFHERCQKTLQELNSLRPVPIQSESLVEIDESWNILMEYPARPITPALLKLYLRVRPQSMASQIMHPIKKLIRSHFERAADDSKQPCTEDDLVELLVVLMEEKCLQTWKRNPIFVQYGDDEEELYSPMEVVVNTLEDAFSIGDFDDESTADEFSGRIIGKLQSAATSVTCVQSPEAKAEEWLREVLCSDEQPDLWRLSETLDILSEEALARVVNIENSTLLFSNWVGLDVVNEPYAQTVLHHLRSFPREVVVTHAAAILKNGDDIMDEGDAYYYHENYMDFWPIFCKNIAELAPAAVTTYLNETLLPRMREAESADDILNHVIMLSDIVAANPDCLGGTAVADECLEILDRLDGGHEGVVNVEKTKGTEHKVASLYTELLNQRGEQQLKKKAKL